MTERLEIARRSEASTDIVHPVVDADRKAMDQIRTASAPGKGHVERGPFDATMEKTPDGAGITYEPGSAGGVSGIWCRPSDASPGCAILYIHGGAYIAGSAAAFRHLAGQVAARAGVATFVPDYRLAPEHRFPAAFDDAHAAYRGLLETDTRAVAIVGDSSGGGLALALTAATCAAARKSGGLAPCAGAAMSPWTDLALTGASLESRADADSFLTKDALAQAAAQYLAGQDARTPPASPLYGDLHGLPPLRVHTGTDEILLDDSRRYAHNARAANVDITLHLWEDMPHVFPSTVGTLSAATQALDSIGAFLRAELDAAMTAVGA